MVRGFVKVMAAVVVMAVSGAALAEQKKPNFTPREVTGVININTASVKELELLPGVGTRTAKLIVAYREKQQFKAAPEIVKVKGVGQGIYRRIKDYLTVTGTTTLAAKPRHAAAEAPAKPAVAAAN